MVRMLSKTGRRTRPGSLAFSVTGTDNDNASHVERDDSGWDALGAINVREDLQPWRFDEYRRDSLHGDSVHSRAARVVAPLGLAQASPMKLPTGFRTGANYRTASSSVITNEGDNKASMKTDAGDLRTMTFQIADITKLLVASTGRSISPGHRTVPDDENANIQHNGTGRRVASTRRATSSSCEFSWWPRPLEARRTQTK